MRGDLHTLKRVCSYASTVMLAGCIVFIALAAITLILGGASFVSDDVKDFLVPTIHASDTDLSIISRVLELSVMFIAMAITLRAIHSIMSEILKDNGPFIEGNSEGFKLISLTFLACSVPLAVLEYLSSEDAVIAVAILLACILISVVMYCLTIIFRYGFVLQDESDHTL